MRSRPGPRGVLFTATFLALASLTCAPAAPKPGESKVAPAGGKSWPTFGGTVHRNMVNLVDRGLAPDWALAKGKVKARNIKWVAPLGGHAYGGPVVAGGRIFVGTNNERPRDPAVKGDKGVLLCLRESDGELLWQAVHDKLPEPDLNDYPRQGLCSTLTVEGDRLYYVSNRAEVVCADVAGDEKAKKPKFHWKYDMIKELGVFVCYAANCSPLVAGDLVFVITANGVDPNRGNLPAPKAPSFIALNKKTGKLAWKSSLPGKNIIRGQWSNPVAATVNGKTQVIFPGGDGWLYGLDARNGDLVWKFDCNPKKAKPYRPGGGGERCFIVATPVVYDNKLYVGVGQEPDDGPGVGHLWCVDVTKTPKGKDKDLSPRDDNFDPKAPVNKDSGLVWHYGGEIKPKPADGPEFVFGRTISTVAVHDGLVYAAQIDGYLHCVDAKTGKKYWAHDFEDGTWASPYYADGKVYLGTNSGDVLIYRAGKKEPKPQKIPMGRPVQTPVVAVNGVLYVSNGLNLYAIKK